MVTLDLLKREDLVRILKEPKNAIAKQYMKLFELDDVELEFKEDAYEAIADKAVERKTGARGLRAIMESCMTDIMYEIPSDENIERCIISKEVVEEGSEPEIIYRKKALKDA